MVTTTSLLLSTTAESLRFLKGFWREVWTETLRRHCPTTSMRTTTLTGAAKMGPSKLKPLSSNELPKP